MELVITVGHNTLPNKQVENCFACFVETMSINLYEDKTNPAEVHEPRNQINL